MYERTYVNRKTQSIAQFVGIWKSLISTEPLILIHLNVLLQYVGEYHTLIRFIQIMQNHHFRNVMIVISQDRSTFRIKSLALK